MGVKFWTKPNYEQSSVIWPAWHNTFPPQDGSLFFARVDNTNVVKEVYWAADRASFMCGSIPVTVDQWLTKAEYKKLMEALWITGPL